MKLCRQYSGKTQNLKRTQNNLVTQISKMFVHRDFMKYERISKYDNMLNKTYLQGFRSVLLAKMSRTYLQDFLLQFYFFYKYGSLVIIRG
jgi:phosphate uptake regulator